MNRFSDNAFLRIVTTHAAENYETKFKSNTRDTLNMTVAARASWLYELQHSLLGNVYVEHKSLFFVIFAYKHGIPCLNILSVMRVDWLT